MGVHIHWPGITMAFFLLCAPFKLKAGSLDEADQIRAQVQKAIHFASGRGAENELSALDELMAFVEYQDWEAFDRALFERLVSAAENKEASRLATLSLLLRRDQNAAPQRTQNLISIFDQVCSLRAEDPQNHELLLAMTNLANVLRAVADQNLLLKEFQKRLSSEESKAKLAAWIAHFGSLEPITLELADHFEKVLSQLKPEDQLILVQIFHRWKAPRQIRTGLYRLLDDPNSPKPLREAAEKALLFTFGAYIRIRGARDMARHPYDSPLQPLRSLKARAQASFSANCLKPLRSARASQSKAPKKP